VLGACISWIRFTCTIEQGRQGFHQHPPGPDDGVRQGLFALVAHGNASASRKLASSGERFQALQFAQITAAQLAPIASSSRPERGGLATAIQRLGVNAIG